MKKFLLISCFLPALLSHAAIDTTEVNSSIKEVTVFFSGAEVKRQASMNLPKGKHLLLFDRLPEVINPQSIQVDGLSKATILSVKHDVKNNNSILKSDKVKAIQDSVHKLQIEVKRIKGKIDVLQTEEEILLQNSNFAGKEKGVEIEELKSAATYYRQRLNSIRNEMIDLSLKINEISDKINKEYKNLNRILAKEKQTYSQVMVAVEVYESTKEMLQLSYYVPTAGWTPSYDFRVKDVNEPLTIIYNANVYQTSGEDWDKVDITLSSNDPSLSGHKPELARWILGERPTLLNEPKLTPFGKELNYNGVGSIKGAIIEQNTKEPIPFANITLFKGNVQILGTTTDFDGNYTLKPVDPGYYDLKVSYIGYQTKVITGLYVKSNNIMVQNVRLLENSDLKIYEEAESITSQELNREEIERMAVRSATDIAIVAGNGVISRDNGSNTYNVRGSRSGDNVTFIDGIKVIGNTSLPKSAINEITVNENDFHTNNYNAASSYRYTSTKQDKVHKDIISNSVNENTLSLEYEIKIPYSIPSDGKDYHLKIKETKAKVDYEYFIVPRVDKDAFLVAHLTDWESLNLLSGNSSLYYQGKYTGASFINANQAEDTLQISLGRDQNIFVSRERNKKVNDKQFYSNDIKETIAWDIVVKNNKDYPVKITLEDQYPVSNRKSIDVDLLDSDQAKVEEKSGFLTWSFELPKGEKKEINFSYEAKYPRSMNVQFY
jgi:hypothetical protein